MYYFGETVVPLIQFVQRRKRGPVSFLFWHTAPCRGGTVFRLVGWRARASFRAVWKSRCWIWAIRSPFFTAATDHKAAVNRNTVCWRMIRSSAESSLYLHSFSSGYGNVIRNVRRAEKNDPSQGASISDGAGKKKTLIGTSCVACAVSRQRYPRSHRGRNRRAGQ